jgi:hypothetical protein
MSLILPSNASMDMVSDVTGNGTLNAMSLFVNATIDYVTGEYTCYMTGAVPVDRQAWPHIVNYTRYEYDVTPAANITTNASGSFSANITMPAVANGNYNVTAIDTAGNVAVSSLSIVSSSFGWTKTYGGTEADIGTGETVQANDGGYVILGDTSSFGAGGSDFCLIKTDEEGNMQWNKTYGGALNDASGDMCYTSDGGYALIGGTYSFGAGSQDFWLVKADAVGTMLWNQTYGGNLSDIAIQVLQTADGGYAVMGYTASFGTGNNDGWLIKTDASGNMEWN